MHMHDTSYRFGHRKSVLVAAVNAFGLPLVTITLLVRRLFAMPPGMPSHFVFIKASPQLATASTSSPPRDARLMSRRQQQAAPFTRAVAQPRVPLEPQAKASTTAYIPAPVTTAAAILQARLRLCLQLAPRPMRITATVAPSTPTATIPTIVILQQFVVGRPVGGVRIHVAVKKLQSVKSGDCISPSTNREIKLLREPPKNKHCQPRRCTLC